MHVRSLVEHTPFSAMLHAQMYSVQMLSDRTCHHVWRIGTSKVHLTGSSTSPTMERHGLGGTICIGAQTMTSMYCSTHRLTDIGRKAQIHRCQNRRLKDILDQQKNHRSNDYAAVHARAKFKLVQHCTRACLASQFASDNDGDFPRLRFSA
jgi:hypothetical protein